MPVYRDCEFVFNPVAINFAESLSVKDDRQWSPGNRLTDNVKFRLRACQKLRACQEIELIAVRDAGALAKLCR